MSSFTDMSTTHEAFLFAICLMIVITLGVAVISLVKRRRNRNNMQELPVHKGDLETKSTFSRSSSIRSSSSTQKSFVEREKELFYADTYGPPTGPPPAIHLTLPEEHEDGTKSDARVVVVSIGPHGEIGLSPLEQEQLPPYQEVETGRLQSLDMNRIGGLKEASSK